jgi:hypothetical protein
MGASESVPAPDLRVKRAMALAKMDMRDVAVFWKHFRKLDKDMRGKVDCDDYYAAIEERRSIYGDGIFEVLDIHHTGAVTFGEFIRKFVLFSFSFACFLFYLCSSLIRTCFMYKLIRANAMYGSITVSS